MSRILTVFCLLIGCTGALTGCGDDEDRQAAKKRAAAAKAKRAKQEAAAQVASEAAKADQAANIYTYTEKPLLDLIPAKPIMGRLEGAAWPIAAVVFEPRGDTWTLTFHDKALPRPTGLSRDSHPLTITLPGVPGPGATFEKLLGEGGSTWKLPAPSAKAKPAADKKKKKKKKKKRRKGEVAPASVAAPASAPAGPRTWTTRNAYVIEITKWDVQPFDDKGPAFQVGGKASGRIGLVYEGSDGHPHAWVAGQFEDAVVRFMGKPSVAYTAAPDPAADEKKAGKAK